MNLTPALMYTAGPVGAAVVGGVIAAFRPPRPLVRSYIQHFAAGVVFAALSLEILPDVMHDKAPVPAAVGFAAGAALMLIVRAFSSRMGRDDDRDAAKRAGGNRTFPRSYVLPIAVDVAIDGLLLGIAFVAGERAGVLLSVALTAELLSLGLATAAELRDRGSDRGISILTTSILGVLTVGGVLVAVPLLGGVGTGRMETLLAFAAAALLYLVTEELLVEAHEIRETPLATSMFFLGFLGLLLLRMAG